MSKISAGLLMYRIRDGRLEVFLVHPGGPFWRNKDAAAWSIPKGEIDPNEDFLSAAKREFQEETGIKAEGTFFPLGNTKLKSGKVVHAWSFEGNCNPATIQSNTVKIEWPPKSGKLQEIPEVDKAAFWPLAEAKVKINPAQIKFLETLEALIKRTS
jgi:predicted NUDIX family NTP pyrophosphohydrolase